MVELVIGIALSSLIAALAPIVNAHMPSERASSAAKHATIEIGKSCASSLHAPNAPWSIDLGLLLSFRCRCIDLDLVVPHEMN